MDSSHLIDPAFDPPDVPFSSMNFSYAKEPMQTWSGPLADPAGVGVSRRKSKQSKKSSVLNQGEQTVIHSLTPNPSTQRQIARDDANSFPGTLSLFATPYLRPDNLQFLERKFVLHILFLYIFWDHEKYFQFLYMLKSLPLGEKS